MSVVAVCASGSGEDGGGRSSTPMETRALVKGSPEAVGRLLSSKNKPSWYTRCYESLARRGLRVLALAYKELPTLRDAESRRNLLLGKLPADWTREMVESDLQFGGFIAFECKIRADSKIVISSLIESGHRVAMLTAMRFSSLHVAKETNIVRKERSYATLRVVETEEQDSKPSSAYWEIEASGAGADAEPEKVPLEVTSDPKTGLNERLGLRRERLRSCSGIVRRG